MKLWEKGQLACGIDEVGRGAFAGPLVVGGVVLKPVEKKSDIKKLLSLGINDSKLITYGKRKLIKELLQEYILYSSVQYISVEQINTIGVGRANKLGFQLVAQDIQSMARINLDTSKIFFLTDAFQIPNVHSSRQKNIIRGDQTSITIAAASILAKVERDTFMENLARKHPGYKFEKNKGYGTLFHRESIKQNGLCPHHRTQFVKSYTSLVP